MSNWGSLKRCFDLLFVNVIHPGQLDVILTIPEVTKRFKKIVAVVFDSWGHFNPLRLSEKFDAIFVSSPDAVDRFASAFGTQVYFLPLGVDALRFGSENDNRPIHVIGYGKKPLTSQENCIRKSNRQPVLSTTQLLGQKSSERGPHLMSSRGRDN